MNNVLAYTAAPLGRLLLSGIFIMSGVHKITAWEETAQRMAEEGMQYEHVLLAGAIACEIIGGVALLLGCCARLGALALLAFLIPATVIFHDFWTFDGQEQQLQMTHFMKNVAIMGGLLIVLGLGPGGLSLSGKRRRRTSAGPGAS